MPTFTGQINATADDGNFDNSGAAFDNSSATLLLKSSGNNAGFFRFPGVTIPNGSTISAAALTVRAASSPGIAANIRIFGELSGNPGQIANAADGQGRAHTTHTVLWSAPVFVSGTDYTSADISTVIQEIVNQGGFASGNALQLFADDESAFPGGVQLVADDGTHPAGRASLSITYGAATPKKSRPFWFFDE